MVILVTGGSGQLGQSLRKVAVEFPEHELVFTDLPEVDIADAGSVRAAMMRVRPEAVINCAAYTAVDRAEAEPDVAESINARGAENVALAAREAGARMVHVSTDYVFDGSAREPIREDASPAPQSVYGRTKLDGERLVYSTGVECAIVRTSWLYSEFGNNFVKTMLRLAETNAEVRVVSDQTGSPTYAPDLARALVRVAENVQGQQTYHYCDRGATTWFALAAQTFALAAVTTRAVPITTAEYPTAARRPEYSVLGTSKIEAIGVVIPCWQDSLAVCVAALKEQKQASPAPATSPVLKQYR